MRPGSAPSKISLASVVLAVTLALMPACSGRPSPPGADVAVTLKDFHVAAAVTRVPPGIVRFRVGNRGPSTHEFVVLRTELPSDGLPLAADGLSVEEDSPWIRHVGEINEVPLGTSRTLVLRLPPGRYVLFCNLEGHYLGGMHFSLEVP